MIAVGVARARLARDDVQQYVMLDDYKYVPGTWYMLLPVSSGYYAY